MMIIFDMIEDTPTHRTYRVTSDIHTEGTITVDKATLKATSEGTFPTKSYPMAFIEKMPIGQVKHGDNLKQFAYGRG